MNAPNEMKRERKNGKEGQEENWKGREDLWEEKREKGGLGGRKQKRRRHERWKRQT